MMLFNFLKRKKPFSLRTRFLLATSGIILALTLSYGAVAIVGYLVSFDKTTYTLLRSQSNLFYSLAQWRNNKLDIHVPTDFTLNAPAFILIYNQQGEILWRQRHIPAIEKAIEKEWLKKDGLYELDTDLNTTRELIKVPPNGSKPAQKVTDIKDKYSSLTHSVSVNHYQATKNLPQLTIVVIDTLPLDLQKTGLVWEWFGYVILANFILVIPMLWLVTSWSLYPIESLSSQISGIEKGEREALDQNPPLELSGLMRNLNKLLVNEQKRYTKYRTTLADLSHSLKTLLAVLQSTLCSLRSSKQMTIEQAEPIMLEQIGRISQQIGYYLHRASIHSEDHFAIRKISSVSALLDNLCSALAKVYQQKGVNLTLDVSPEITWIGQPIDFMEIMGNIIENACKYCLEFVEVSASSTENSLTIIVDDDGPGVAEDKRDLIFLRGQRVDTLRPGQGLGLSIAAEIIEQYDGDIAITHNPLGGARVIVTFRQQSPMTDS